jgi:uncharacterized membrane protein
MNHFSKPMIILPIILGLVIGGLLFAFGEQEDAPGLCAIGIAAGFILIMIGINRTGMIKKGLLLPILLFFFAVFIASITTSIMLDGELGDKPWYSVFVYVAAFILLLLGLLRLQRFHKSN